MVRLAAFGPALHLCVYGRVLTSGNWPPQAQGGEPWGGGRGSGEGDGAGRPDHRTHLTLAATEDMASLLSALLREAAAPMVEAAAHPPASERTPRPPPPLKKPHRARARTRAQDTHGHAGPSARPAAPGAAALDRGRRSAHRSVRVGAGLSAVTSG